jgi:hypothetical protein
VAEDAFSLLDSAIRSKTIQREYVLSQFEKLYKPAFLSHWKTQIYYKQSLFTKICHTLASYEIFDIELWHTILETIYSYKRIYNIDNYNKILNAIILVNSNPRSLYFQKIDKEIEAFKERITNNPNKDWKYDVEVGFFLILILEC